MASSVDRETMDSGSAGQTGRRKRMEGKRMSDVGVVFYLKKLRTERAENISTTGKPERLGLRHRLRNADVTNTILFIIV